MSQIYLDVHFLAYWKVIFHFLSVSWFHVVPSDYHGNMAQRTDHEMLEEENDKMVDHLSSKVQALKSVLCDYLYINATGILEK